MSFDLWTEASRDVEAEQSLRALTSARVQAASAWPFLAAADSHADFTNRLALVQDRIEAAADAHGVTVLDLTASLREDFDAVLAAKKDDDDKPAFLKKDDDDDDDDDGDSDDDSDSDDDDDSDSDSDDADDDDSDDDDDDKKPAFLKGKGDDKKSDKDDDKKPAFLKNKSSLFPVVALEEGIDPLLPIVEAVPSEPGTPEKPVTHTDHFTQGSISHFAAVLARHES